MNPSDLKDAFRRDLAPRLHNYPAPEVPIWDTSGDCVCLRISEQWTAFIVGVLDVLLQESLWTGDPEPAILSIQELMLALYGESELMNCDPSTQVTNITFEGGTIIVHYADESTSVVEGSETIVTGVNAIGGGFEVEQGGEFTEVNPDCPDPCNDYPDTPVYDKSGDQRSCNIATNLTEWFFDRMNDALDAAELANDVMKAVGSSLRYFPPAYLIYEAYVAVVFDWFDVGISAVRAGDTVEMRDQWKEALYCFIRDNGHVLDAAGWETFKTDYFPDVAGSYTSYVASLETDAVVSEAHKASYGEASGCETFNCSDEWCVIWDFALGALGWDDYANAGRGHHNGTDAFVQDSVSGITRVDIISPVFTACTVTRLEVDNTTDYSTPNANRYAALRDGATVLDEQEVTTVLDETDATNEFQVGAGGVTQVRIAYQTADGGGGGTCSVFRIRMYGTGTPPPEVDAC